LNCLLSSGHHLLGISLPPDKYWLLLGEHIDCLLERVRLNRHYSELSRDKAI